MPRIKGTTDSQTKFLRSFHTSPFGPGAADWPSPGILRRWLRRPEFYQALLNLKKVLIFQSDFQLLSAAASASQALHTTVTTGHEDGPQAKQIQALASLLKLAHLRERFTASEEPSDAQDDEPVLRIHPNVSDEEAEAIFARRRESDAGYKASQSQKALG